MFVEITLMGLTSMDTLYSKPLLGLELVDIAFGYFSFSQ